MILPVAFPTDLKTCAEEMEMQKSFVTMSCKLRKKRLWRNITNILRGTGTFSCCVLLKLL